MFLICSYIKINNYSSSKWGNDFSIFFLDICKINNKLDNYYIDDDDDDDDYNYNDNIKIIGDYYKAKCLFFRLRERERNRRRKKTIN